MAYAHVDEKVTPDEVVDVPAHPEAHGRLDQSEVVRVERVQSHPQPGKHGSVSGGGPESGSAANAPSELPSFPGDL
jgi:hypothetical protein